MLICPCLEVEQAQVPKALAPSQTKRHRRELDQKRTQAEVPRMVAMDPIRMMTHRGSHPLVETRLTATIEDETVTPCYLVYN